MFRQKAPSSYHNTRTHPVEQTRADAFHLEEVVETLEASARCAVLSDAAREDRTNTRQRLELGGSGCIQIEEPAGTGGAGARLVAGAGNSDALSIPQAPGLIHPPQIRIRARPSGRGQGVGEPGARRQAVQTRAGDGAVQLDDDLSPCGSLDDADGRGGTPDDKQEAGGRQHERGPGHHHRFLGAAPGHATSSALRSTPTIVS
jgi:hypothetical protein